MVSFQERASLIEYLPLRPSVLCGLLLLHNVCLLQHLQEQISVQLNQTNVASQQY